MRYTLLFLFLGALGLTVQAQNIPIDFESDDITYTWGDFGGGEATLIDNPDASGINTSGTVVQMIKFEGEIFGGSTLQLDGPINFGDNTAFDMKVWANRVGAPVLFKLEGPAPVEVSMNTTVANEWETLTFDFAGLTNAEYTGITIIYDLGTVGNGSADFTLYLDDIEFSAGNGLNEPNLPIDFESDELDYVFNNFGGGVGERVDNPDASGINTSTKIGRVIKFEGEVFGGTTLDIDGAIDFEDASAISMKVWANRVGAPVLLKLEGPAPVEMNIPTTVANEWEELVFDFTGLTGGAYTAITIIYDLGTVGNGSDDFTLYFDDIQLSEGDGVARPEIPINFEDAELTYEWSDFGGGVATVVENPDQSGINTSATIGQMVKFEGEVFGGSTLQLGGAIDFGENTVIAMKTWANRVGAPVLLKLEGPAPVEMSVNTTVANEWEELLFDFSGLTGGVYTAITIIYDLGTVGDGGPDFTLYFDDLEFSDDDGVLRPSLPISFESDEVTYEFNNFDGGDASVIENPDASGINTSAWVGRMIKNEGAIFAGATLRTEDGVDFGENTAIRMKTWANRVGAPILFKLEGPVPVEVTMMSTVANEWEELVFDFTGMTDGEYTDITLIYDLGVVGNGGPDFTFYFDDIELTDISNVQDFSSLGISMYPNPATDFVNIEAQTVIDRVVVYDLLGRSVVDFQPTQAVSTLDVSKLAPGTYALRVFTAGGEAVAKFVKR